MNASEPLAVSSPSPASPADGARPRPSLGEPGGWEPGAHRGLLTVTDDFAVLDDPLEQREFTTLTEGPDGQRTARSVLMVQGMYCAACADAVEGALCGLHGVRKAEVHAATRRLTVEWDPAQTRVSALAQAVGRVGYRLLPQREALGVEQRIIEGRRVLWRLFVSGICMMQVMMYTWPAYVTQPGEIPPDLVQLLRWASWVLSVPVLLFASGSFFAGAWRDLKRGRIGMDTPVSVGILVTFVVSSLATFDPTGPWGDEVWFDSLTMFVFFLMGGRYLEFKARSRTAGALDELMTRLPEVTERMRPDGTFESVSARRLAVGDVVRVQAGQAFPGDGTLLSASARVDEALLTGESEPVARARGEGVIAGSFNLAGPVEVRIDRLGADTRFAQIVALMERASTDKPRLAQLADRIAAPFLVVVVLAALVAAVLWWQVDQSRGLAVAVSVLIVTCPCALSLATPAAMLASAGALAKRGVLVRRLQAFEALARVDTVVFDKTGTLTQDRLGVRSFRVRPGADDAEALSLAAGLAAGSLHPASRAVVEFARGQGVEAASTQGWLELTESVGKGVGAVHPVYGPVRLGAADWTGAGASVDEQNGQPCVHVADGQGWLATFELDEGVRVDAASAVARLRELGMQVWLMSGDRLQSAHRIARLVGIDHVVAGASPEDKLERLTRLQNQGHRVAMVGDGINDGPVLAQAHTSFALGSAAPLAQAQADYLVQSGRLTEVAHAVEQARQTMRVVKQNLAWAAAYNALSIPLALAGFMPPWAAGLGMATSSFGVIGNALRLNRSESPVTTVA